jgi:hypothetical protein
VRDRVGEAAAKTTAETTATMSMDAYHERASECLRLAASSPDIDDRRALRELALCWLRLSDRAEEFRNYGKDARVRAA